jgi:sortase A
MKLAGYFLKLFFIGVLGIAFGAGIVSGCRALVSWIAPTHTSVAATATVTTVSPPAWLIIPSINVNAPVTNVGVNGQGALGVPADATHVAWYKDGPRPGELGAAVIDGHLDTIHTSQAVFYNLGKLAPGDKVEVRTTNNQTVSFTVTRVAEYPYNASTTDIFSATDGGADLNLITCAGDWIPSAKLYNERIVVFTKRSS